MPAARTGCAGRGTACLNDMRTAIQMQQHGDNIEVTTSSWTDTSGDEKRCCETTSTVLPIAAFRRMITEAIGDQSPEAPSVASEAPDIEQLIEWESEGGCEATDGCWVEPDGVCEHGCKSWLLELGMI